MRAVAALLVAVTTTLTLGCGGGQTRGAAFDPRWSNDGGKAAAAFQRAFAKTPIPRGADVAVGVVGKDTLVGVSLTGGTPWTYKHALDDRPVIAGGVVVGVGRGELFALDARTGKALWQRSVGGRLRGAGDDGKTTVVSLVPTTGVGSSVLAIGRDGLVVRQIEEDAQVGSPAVVDRWAFLPWGGQYVSAYDLTEGEESMRVLLRHQTSRVQVSGGALYFGEQTLTRFDEHIGGATQGSATSVGAPTRELPGNPKWLGSGLVDLPTKWGAGDAIRLYGRPAAEGAGIEGRRFAATYYGVVVGLDAVDGNLTWATAQDTTIIGGAAYAGGFALCDEEGRVRFFDAVTGAVGGEVALGKKLDACLVQADGFTRPAAGDATSLASQLAKVVAMPNAELVMMQKLLLREMATLPDEIVTTTLLELAASERTPPPLLEDVRAVLAARRTGTDAMLAALGRPYDYLAGVLRPPPVGPLADALAAVGERRAAPLLAGYLNDPTIGVDDTRRIAAALGVLGTKAERPALETFFAHYRCVAEDEALVNAVVAAATALVAQGGSELVSAALADPLTAASVKPRLEGLPKKK